MVVRQNRLGPRSISIADFVHLDETKLGVGVHVRSPVSSTSGCCAAAAAWIPANHTPASLSILGDWMRSGQPDST